MSEFAGDLPDRRRSKMNKIAVNAFIHGGALSDPIELNPNLARIFQEKSKEVDAKIWYTLRYINLLIKSSTERTYNQRGGQVNARY